MAINKRKILQSAQKHLQKGALDRALKDYRTLLEADPKDSNIRLKVGDIYLRQGKSEDAVAHYLKVAEKFMADGFDAKAVALYKQVTKIDPKRYDVLTPLSELYHRMGLTSDALKALQTAADAHYREGNKPAALEVLRKMATLDPSNTINRLKVAELLRHEGMASEALSEYRECGAELERQGDVEGRANVIEKILELAPDSGQDLHDLGRACLEVRKWTRAEEVGDRLARSAPGFEVEACEIIAEAYKGLRRDDALPEIYRRMAEALRQRGDDAAAREIQQRFDLHDGLSAEAPPALETDDDALLEDMLDLEGSDADSDLELDEPVLQPAAPAVAPTAPASPAPATPAAVGEPPQGDPEQLLAEASVYLRYGKRDRAVACLHAVQQQSQDPEILTRVAETFEGCGETQAAVEVLQAAAEGARAQGADEAFKRLHGRIAGLDPKAAAALGQAAQAAAPAVVADTAPADSAPDFDEESAADFAGDSGSDFELDIDVDDGPGEVSAPSVAVAGDLEFDFDEVEAAVTDPGSAAVDDGVEIELPGVGEVAGDSAASEAPDEFEFSFDEDIVTSAAEPAVLPDDTSPDVISAVSGEDTVPPDSALEVDTSEFDVADPSPAPTAAEEAVAAAPAAEPVAAPAAEASAPADDSSGGAVELIRESLEEAAFYFQQGLFDESEALYQRILEMAPNHPQALVRLGEIEAAREASAAPVESAAPAVVPEPEAAAAVVSEPEPEAAPEAAAPVLEAPAAPEIPGLDITAPVEPRAHEADESGDFDLAKELSGAFHEDEAGAASGSETEAEGFEEVFAAFKKGVEKELGDEDFEARYDLGIAYKEMGLIDDALGEFRAALQGPKRKLACLHMMALCALELGNAQDAVANLEQALALPDIPEEQQMALRFDLGRAHRQAGANDRAKECFEAVAAVDPDFCEVGECLAALERGEEAPSPIDEDAFESFEDLVMDDDDDAEPAADTEPEPTASVEEVEEEESYESFGDLMDDDDDDFAAEAAAEGDDVEGPAGSDDAEILEAALIPEDEDEEAVDFVGSESEFPAAEEAPAEPEAPEAEPVPKKTTKTTKKKKKRKKISFV